MILVKGQLFQNPGSHGLGNNCRSICVNHFLNVKIWQTVLFFIFSHTLQ
jgi:hypothetical protein